MERNLQELPALVTVQQLQQLLRGVVGRETAYELARRFGFRLGRRLVIPRRVVLDLLEGRLDLGDKEPLR